MSPHYAGPGRIVLHNIAAEGAKPEYRPAIIVRNFGDPNDAACAVNLQVFLDGENDRAHAQNPGWTLWKTSRVHGNVGDFDKWIWPQELPV